jgi:hypothetical protein
VGYVSKYIPKADVSHQIPALFMFFGSLYIMAYGKEKSQINSLTASHYGPNRKCPTLSAQTS